MLNKDNRSWPKVDTKLVFKEKINMVIQVNGKTRDVIKIEKGVNQNSVVKLCKNNDKIKNKIDDKL